MAGTQLGGMRAARTNKLRYGKDFYGLIGAKGGRLGKTGGFASGKWCDNPCKYDSIWGDHKVQRCAGAKGGTISRIKPKGTV